MQEKVIDLSEFKRDTGFYGQLSFLATIKNFNLQEIRARYLKSKKNKNTRTGSVERRAPAMGGIMAFKLNAGELIQADTLTELREPRGIARHKELLAFSSENKVYVLSLQGIRTLEDPWFSYIHTVDFDSEGTRLLVSSSGFDVILEYGLEDLKRLREWWAWENGFAEGTDPQSGERVILSRVPVEGVHGVRVIANPLSDSLPTAMRAAFINSVEYDRNDDNRFIATFFHAGTVFGIDAKSGTSTALISSLKNPHGGSASEHGLMATSTRTGEVILKSEGRELSYSFKNLGGKDDALGVEEWIQNSKRLSDGSILSIDSNRTAFVIFHPELEVIDVIPYPDNLAVQDLVIVDDLGKWAQQIQSI